MLVLGITSLVISVVGFIFGRYSGSSNMEWKPRLIWIASLVLVTFAAGQGGYAIAAAATKADAIGGFHQFLNGTVVAADTYPTTCTEDGACRYTYDCDPYTVSTVHYDSKGNYSYTSYSTEYHDCPYVTVEHNFTTTDSLGGTHKFDTYIDAQATAWRAGRVIPSNIPRGTPKMWQKARTALDAGRGIPMTEVGEYENYILASQDSLLKASSDDIAKLKKSKLLPEHTQSLSSPIYDDFNARKVSFVGIRPSNEAAWQDAVMQFNSALGMTLRGDLHVVVIKDSLLPSGVSPQDYANAVKAYWLNNLGKYAFAKNGIMLVLGVNNKGTTIDWAKSTTGMPIGNGAMLQAINLGLTDTPFTVTKVMGKTYASVVKGKATYVLGQGVVPQATMVTFPFKRACMECKDKGEASTDGFVHLTIDAPVTFWGYFLTIFVVLVVTGFGWAAFSYFSFSVPSGSGNDRADPYDSSTRLSNLRQATYNSYKTKKKWRNY